MCLGRRGLDTLGFPVSPAGFLRVNLSRPPGTPSDAGYGVYTPGRGCLGDNGEGISTPPPRKTNLVLALTSSLWEIVLPSPHLTIRAYPMKTPVLQRSETLSPQSTGFSLILSPARCPGRIVSGVTGLKEASEREQGQAGWSEPEEGPQSPAPVWEGGQRGCTVRQRPVVPPRPSRGLLLVALGCLVVLRSEGQDKCLSVPPLF